MIPYVRVQFRKISPEGTTPTDCGGKDLWNKWVLSPELKTEEVCSTDLKFLL